MKHIALAALCGLFALSANAFTLTKAEGASETAYAEWAPVNNAVRYEVTCSGASEIKVDPQLVRLYSGMVRVDVPGLSKGEYTLTVKAYDASGSLLDSAVSGSLSVKAYTREGFAFNDGYIPGAYKADGTLKDGAEVLYVTAGNVNTVTLEVIKNTKGEKDTKTGVAEILSAIGKGLHKTPLAIRIIGSIADTEFAGLKDGNYINFQGNNNAEKMTTTSSTPRSRPC